MMRVNRRVRVAAAVLVCGLWTGAHRAAAALIVQEPVPGQKVTVDTVTGSAWYWDMAGFINMTYAQQMAAIPGLNAGSGFAGLTGWHMAPAAELNTLVMPVDYSAPLPFNPTAVVPGQSTLWAGRLDEVHPYPANHYGRSYTDFGGGTWLLWSGPEPDASADPQLSAWVVTNSVPAIPVPDAGVLAGIGATAVGWLRRHRAL